MPLLSVIVPLAPAEMAWQSLLLELAALPDGTEILLVSSNQAPIPSPLLELPRKQLRFLTGKPGRAGQMNAGASEANGDFLWFLHADSQLSEATIPALQQSINKHPKCLLYFDLIFLNDASWLMRLNSWGVQCRTRIFKTPFGDQGFCIKKTLFNAIGGFPEHLPYGEDHVFVWHARQHGLSIKSTNAPLYTSARKYKTQGWLKTTCLHQYLWIKQAWPEWRKLRSIKKT